MIYSEEDFRWIRFADLFSVSIRNGVYVPKDKRGSGYKMLNMGELFAYPRVPDMEMERVQLSDREIEMSLLEDGDLLFARRSLVLSGAGKCSIYVGKSGTTTFESSIIRVRLNKEVAWPEYYFYFFNSQLGRFAIESIAEQVAVAGIRGSDLKELEVPCPDLHEQRAIAEVLGSLDDKIEANRRQNETLEATARAIFKSWFVEFDPVHAKARGELPASMDAETAALFPDRFEESELGLIPSGWQIVPIGDHVKANKGLSYKGAHLEETIEEGLPMHNLNSVNEWGGYKFDGIKFYSGDYKPRHEVRPGDLIVANTEQGFNLLLIASPAIIPAVFGDKGIISHHIYKLEIKRKSPLTRLFLYHMIMLPPFRDVLQGYTNGTTVNMLPSDAFEKPQFVMPPAELMQRFNALIAPMLEQVERNYERSTTLAETRDALLPRLVSGELRVGELE